MGRIAIVDASERSRANARRAVRRLGYETDVFESVGEMARRMQDPARLAMALLAGAKDSESSIAQIEALRALVGPAVPTLHLVPKNQLHQLAPLCHQTRDEIFGRLTAFNELSSLLRVYMRNVHLRVPEVDWAWERYRFLPMMNAVEFGACTVELRTDEFDLATELFRRTGHTLTRQHLCMAIWGHDGHDRSRSLDACASRLRRALQLEENGWKLRAVWGAGYRLDGPSATETPFLKEPSFEVS
ncbi:helix-turn-helix domain-containing protein [Variovorax sp. LT1R16]|uniref:helix-turn-helix domain-containing protein n=1 Tax=Variovorax sp. LT1R16 TaxID=3443728 RepID=UPI003F4703EA